MPASDAGAGVRRRRPRRRRQDKPALSARLVLDDHVKTDVGIVSEDLFAELFPHLLDRWSSRFLPQHSCSTASSLVANYHVQSSRQPSLQYPESPPYCDRSLDAIPLSRNHHMGNSPRHTLIRPCPVDCAILSLVIGLTIFCPKPEAGRAFAAVDPQQKRDRDPGLGCCCH